MLSFDFILGWLVLGAFSVVYWRTKYYDLTVIDLLLVFAGALAGPISFVVGWLITREWKFDYHTVLIKKRRD